jgi:N-acetylneuraminic acid mutarotase
VEERLFVFGSSDDTKGSFGDLYIFDTRTLVWTRGEHSGDIPSHTPGNRATVVNQTDMYIFGGGLNDTYILDSKVPLPFHKNRLNSAGPPADADVAEALAA